MKREIRIYPDPVLQQKCEPVQQITGEIEGLARDMVETMYEDDGIGLAASQVGESPSLITVDVTGPQRRQELLVMLNPRIVFREGEMVQEEGCLSLPEFKSPIRRSEKVSVDWLDLEGNSRRTDAEGLLAACLQHEIDHLNGILLLDRVSWLKRSMYVKKMKKYVPSGQ